MKKILLAINHAYLMFGVTIYVGVLWALHFFWYPSWQVITVDTVQDHFIKPTAAATDFFWIVVPLMFIANAVLIYKEWRSKLRWIAILAMACISGASYVGQELIIPINDLIATGNVSASELATKLERWMVLNDVRWIIMSVMWLLMMYYFYAKGRLMDVIDN